MAAPLAAGPDSVITNSRAGLRLSSTDVDELTERLQALVYDFAQRPTGPDGIRVLLITTLHRLDAPESGDKDR